MALVLATLAQALPGGSGGDYPTSRDAAAVAWAQAVGAYASAITPPLLYPIAPAQEALRGALFAAFGQPAAAVAPAMETAFATFALALVGLMAPAYLATPPAGPVGFAAALSQMPRPATRAEGALRVATPIDTWMRTGTATLVTVPPPPPIPWS